MDRLEAPVVEPPSSKLTSVAVTGVSRTYRAGRAAAPVPALERLHLSVGEREVVAVVGPSGCGKSTLLELVAGLQEPDEGSVRVNGQAGPRERLSASAFLPQRDLLLPWRDAIGNAALALECQGVRPREAREAAVPLFARFGLAEFERARPASLSGGMRQRVAFLRTLLTGRPLLLLDEPFAALDSITRADMQEWLAAALAEEPRTVLCVTHDVEEALFLADRVAVMSGRPGRVVSEVTASTARSGPRREVVTDPAFVELKERVLEALES